MYRWLQDSIWDSVMINYDGYTQSEISYNVYKGIPYWKRIIFGFFFGFIRGYIICVCIFATANIFYNHNNWPFNIKKSLTFPYVKKGSSYLIKEFPNEKKYKESKEKIEEL